MLNPRLTPGSRGGHGAAGRGQVRGCAAGALTRAPVLAQEEELAQRDGGRSAAVQRALLAARHRNYERLSARSPDGFEQEIEPDLAPDPPGADPAGDRPAAAAQLGAGGPLPGTGLLDALDDDGAASRPAGGAAAEDAEEPGRMPASTSAFMGSAGQSNACFDTASGSFSTVCAGLERLAARL